MRTRQPAAPFQLLPDVQESQLAFVGSLGSEALAAAVSVARSKPLIAGASIRTPAASAPPRLKHPCHLLLRKARQPREGNANSRTAPG